MLQAVQHQKSGEIEVKELPAPTVRSGWIVVATQASLISAGTERASVEKSKASLIERARKQPEDVRQVIDMAKKEGVLNTIRKVQNKLDSYRALGYSAAGVVLESGCDEFAPGDRVACAGAGYAVHAEVISVPKNLAVKLPENVSFEDASFTTLGAIALQGIRQADPRLGENVAVIGLGLLGQLTVGMLKANGCRVIGLDIDESQFSLAKEFGADATAPSNGDAVNVVESFTRGIGADAVIITAGTSSNAPMELAIKMTRKKGRIVVVGAVGMDLPRSPFYEKELEITISCSYGPGRYDPGYEEEGHDYPAGYVRWTENRNMEAVLDMIASGALNVGRIITHRYPITQAATAYDLITGKINESFVGVVLTYPEKAEGNLQRTISLNPKSAIPNPQSNIRLGFIGAGSFAQGHLIPHLTKLDLNLVAAVTATPANARSVAEKFGFAEASTDSVEIIGGDRTNTLFIATQHDTHGDYVARGLKASKQVFVEKPLAINREELERIRELAEGGNNRVMVGFNRRFSESFVAVKKHFEGVREPLSIFYRVNAGHIPLSSWVQRPEQGGRIIGEGCHFIDTMQYLTGARPVSVEARAIRSENTEVKNADTVTITITFDNGSIGTLHYFSNGAKSIPKEYCEVYGGGRTGIMDDFRRVTLASGTKSSLKKFDGSKGHREEVIATINAMRSGEPMPISFQSLYDTTLATIEAVEKLR
ncbi:MAG: bi-domain-containing oxidoreductase [Candidatus Kapaibacterium sp.]